MSAKPNDSAAALPARRRHQVRLARKWMTWWIPWIFVVGFCVSIIGLVSFIAGLPEEWSPTPGVYVHALFAACFGHAVALWVLGFWLIKPRIVPYFCRTLGEYRGKTMTAFRRGLGGIASSPCWSSWRAH